MKFSFRVGHNSGIVSHAAYSILWYYLKEILRRSSVIKRLSLYIKQQIPDQVLWKIKESTNDEAEMKTTVESLEPLDNYVANKNKISITVIF